MKIHQTTTLLICFISNIISVMKGLKDPITTNNKGLFIKTRGLPPRLLSFDEFPPPLFDLDVKKRHKDVAIELVTLCNYHKRVKSRKQSYKNM